MIIMSLLQTKIYIQEYLQRELFLLKSRYFVFCQLNIKYATERTNIDCLLLAMINNQRLTSLDKNQTIKLQFCYYPRKICVTGFWYVFSCIVIHLKTYKLVLIAEHPQLLSL